MTTAAQSGVYYHVTRYDVWPDVRANGLRSIFEEAHGGTGHVWLFTDAGQALAYSEGFGNPAIRPCIVVVRTDRAVPTSAGIPGAYWVEGRVRADEIYEVIRPDDLHHYEVDAARWRKSGSVTAAAIDNDYSDSVMICLKPSEKILKAVADMDECTEDIDELHITLFYFGSIEDTGGEPAKERLYRALYDFAIHDADGGLTGQMNGFGIFQNEADVLVGLWDLPGAAEFRTRLMAKVVEHGVEPREENHGFTPHLTLSYDDGKVTEVPRVPDSIAGTEEHFTSLWLVWGEEWTEVTFS